MTKYMNKFTNTLIIMEGKYGAIDTDYSSCHCYYIIKFSSLPYNIQEDLIIDEKVISPGGTVCEGTYFFPININSCYYVLLKTKSINTIVSLGTIINVNVNVICYDLKDVFPPCLLFTSHNCYNIFPRIHIPMKNIII